MVLLRHFLGDVLRRLRLRQGRTLREVSAAARVSLGYLSEVERGQKEASSELLAAICTALETPLSQVLREVSDNFALAELQNEPVLTGVREPSLLRAGASVRPDHGRLAQARGAVVVFEDVAEHMDVDEAVRHISEVGEAVRQISDVDDVARRIRDVTDMVPV